jgi:hypothetical protein
MLKIVTWRLPVLAMALTVFGTSDTLAQRGDLDVEGIMEELTVALELTEEQVPQVAGLLQGFGQALNEATATAEDEEPDTQKMIGGVKAARAAFQEELQEVLTPEQFTALQELVDEVFQEIFESIAELKITDMRAPLELTDEQAEALKPVMGGAMRGLVAVIFEYGDKRMGIRTKLRMANALKSIQAEMKAGMAEVLTPEQMEAYEAMKAAQKEEQG